MTEKLRALEERFDCVVVEGVGGWLVPIRRDFFVADLAAQMRLPVLVVALNRLGCFNHTILTVRSIAAHGLVCAGVLLNSPEGVSDIASTTNADILRQILDVPILSSLPEEAAGLTPEWRPNHGFSRVTRDSINFARNLHKCIAMIHIFGRSEAVP